MVTRRFLLDSIQLKRFDAAGRAIETLDRLKNQFRSCSLLGRGMFIHHAGPACVRASAAVTNLPNKQNEFRDSRGLRRAVSPNKTKNISFTKIFTRHVFDWHMPGRFASFTSSLSSKAPQMHRQCCSHPRAQYLPARASFYFLPGC